MKRIITAIMIVFLLFPGFAAAAPGNYGSPGGEQVGNGETNTVPGEEQRLRAEENEASGDRVRAAENATPREGEFAPDRNQVRLAVHALLGAENRSGGIGQNISAIAREVNNSVQKTFEAEEQIRARHGFIRSLFGGDTEAARLIEEETQRNRERATELRCLIGNCTCDDATRTMLREQVRTIEQEQDRLRTIASEEMQVRGLFSWR
ncbi:hypothetical protein [Methanoculleus chikugoensis]|uniref:Secreted protein n=1 Tax=Methanoculleus chikugoensis TaxID=118126 RepID=A0ABM7H3S5_9EURY|nr:hypothetical protein [Methanoculleus chikugoensis]BBL67468.1 hypothetical protein MchiMG62_06490 [Methanoculleus chikugoensis]